MKILRNLFWLLIAAVALTAQAAAPNVTPLGAIAQQLHSPARVAADAAGNIYVTDPAAGRVVIFDSFGQQRAVHDGFAGPLAIAVASDGRIYLSEEQSGSVSVFDAQWNLLYQLGAGTNEFQLPGNLAVDPLAPDTVYVSDSPANLVRIYTGATPTGQFGGGGSGNGQFDFPAGICVRTNGEVLVVDQNNDRVQVFTNGVFARNFSLDTSSGGGGLNFGGPSGRSQALFVDNAGRAFVADTMQGTVKIFDADTGAFLGNAGDFGSAPGQLNMPVGLVLDSFNRLCVASANNARVELFGVDSFLNFSVQAPGGNIAAGSNLIFTVTSGGTGQTFQWQKNSASLVGATNGTLAITNATSGDGGNYSVVITGASGSITSSVTPVTVLASPNILSDPQSQTVLAGTDVNFSVVASGSNLNLQWQFNRQNLNGATNASLILPAVQAAQAGQYAVVMTNAVGSIVSAPACLTVITPPVVMDIVDSAMLTNQLFGLTVNLDPGFSYTLEASADLFQWQSVAIFNGGGLFDFVDTDSTNYLNRFYRLRWSP
jgi:DNA-binding beta-propeller fold protein YncE